MAILLLAGVMASSAFYIASRRASINPLETLLGPKYRGYIEYNPSTTDHEQRAIIDAANKRLVDEKWLGLTEQQIQMYKKLLKYDSERRLWKVAYLHDEDFLGDFHTTILFVEVDQDLGSRFTRLIEM